MIIYDYATQIKDSSLVKNGDRLFLFGKFEKYVNNGKYFNLKFSYPNGGIDCILSNSNNPLGELGSCYIISLIYYNDKFKHEYWTLENWLYNVTTGTFLMVAEGIKQMVKTLHEANNVIACKDVV